MNVSVSELKALVKEMMQIARDAEEGIIII